MCAKRGPTQPNKNWLWNPQQPFSYFKFHRNLAENELAGFKARENGSLTALKRSGITEYYEQKPIIRHSKPKGPNRNS